jgi:hypothetical protein
MFIAQSVPNLDGAVRRSGPKFTDTVQVHSAPPYGASSFYAPFYKHFTPVEWGERK